MILRNRPLQLALVTVAAAAAVAMGCVVEVDPFSGKLCETSRDCPDEYVCVIARLGASRTCEIPPPLLLEQSNVTVDGGDFYCGDVQKALLGYCVSCHGETPKNEAPNDLRLDYFEEDGGLPGAFELRGRIRERLRQRTMPPRGYAQPNFYERSILVKWGAGPGHFCGADSLVDGGLDAGPVDSGFDAGRVDSGVDAGRVDSGIDAGRPDSGVDAGVDAGRPDAGPDAGRPDAGDAGDGG